MMCPFDAIGATASTFLSQNYGAKKKDRVYEGFRISLLLAIGYGMFAGIIMIFFGRIMSMMFVSSIESDVLDASYRYLRHMGYFYPVLGALIDMRMSVQGLGYTSHAMIGGALEMVARCLVAFIFVPIFAFEAITWTDQCAWTVALLYFIPMAIYVFKQMEKKLKVG